MPLVASRVDHTDVAGHLASPPHLSTVAFGNAWWGRVYRGFTFPPSPSLRLVPVSLHLHDWAEVETTETAAWLRRQGPVGARDHTTLLQLQEMGVPSYFSACLTLTLDPALRLESPRPYSKVLVIDTVAFDRSVMANLIPPGIMKAVESYTVNLGVSELVSGRPPRPTFHQPFQFAYGNLLEIARAKLVITARIHVALPAVALGTPALWGSLVLTGGS